MDKRTFISIGARVELSQTLSDFRRKTYGFSFGTIEESAKRYGIKYVAENGYIKFTGPKQRLQMFAEVLHFSRIQYFAL